MSLASVNDERVGGTRNPLLDSSSSISFGESLSGFGRIRMHEADLDGKLGPSLAIGQLEVGVHGIGSSTQSAGALEALQRTEELALRIVDVADHQAGLLKDLPRKQVSKMKGLEHESIIILLKDLESHHPLVVGQVGPLGCVDHANFGRIERIELNADVVHQSEEAPRGA